MSRDGTLNFLKHEVTKLKGEGRFITPRVLESEQAPVCTIDGEKVVNLTSNNYLALADHPSIKEAAIKAVKDFGVGTAAVRTINGTMTLHKELERRFAKFKDAEAAILLQSGFATNVAVCQTLMSDPEDFLISDELNHASIIDGARLAKSKRQVYPHKDMKFLAQILVSPEAQQSRRVMIVTDGVFSMDGDIAPLPQIYELARKYGAFVMVDDAHASGVLGPGGKGTVAHFKLEGKIAIQIGTLSKAFAAVGGYVASTQAMCDYMGSVARPYLFSSSHPPSVVATCLAGLDVLENEPERLKKLWENSAFFKKGLKEMGYDIGASETPITPVMVGDTDKAKKLSAELFKEGVFALAIGFPTVPKGKERLRTIVTAGHTRKDLTFALEKFHKVGRKLAILA